MSLDDVEVRYNKAVMELKRLIELLRNGEKRRTRREASGRVTSLFGKEQFCAMVEKAKHHIHEETSFKLCSQTDCLLPLKEACSIPTVFSNDQSVTLCSIFQEQRMSRLQALRLETLVKLENGVLHTFPLAGTRPRGKTMRKIKHWKQAACRWKGAGRT